MRPIENPFQHAHVFAVAGPHEFAVGMLAEPIHMEDARAIARALSHAKPVDQIIADVESDEGEHRHGISIEDKGSFLNCIQE
jgi:hypothetical protein